MDSSIQYQFNCPVHGRGRVKREEGRARVMFRVVALYVKSRRAAGVGTSQTGNMSTRVAPRQPAIIDIGYPPNTLLQVSSVPSSSDIPTRSCHLTYSVCRLQNLKRLWSFDAASWPLLHLHGLHPETREARALDHVAKQNAKCKVQSANSMNIQYLSVSIRRVFCTFETRLLACRGTMPQPTYSFHVLKPDLMLTTAVHVFRAAFVFPDH